MIRINTDKRFKHKEDSITKLALQIEDYIIDNMPGNHGLEVYLDKLIHNSMYFSNKSRSLIAQSDVESRVSMTLYTVVYTTARLPYTQNDGSIINKFVGTVKIVVDHRKTMKNPFLLVLETD